MSSHPQGFTCEDQDDYVQDLKQDGIFAGSRSIGELKVVATEAKAVRRAAG